MQIAFAGTDVWLSDGGTNVLPVTVHAGEGLTAAQKMENSAAIHNAWKWVNFDHIQHSLGNGFYQGMSYCIPRNWSRDTRQSIGSTWAACGSWPRG